MGADDEKKQPVSASGSSDEDAASPQSAGSPQREGSSQPVSHDGNPVAKVYVQNDEGEWTEIGMGTVGLKPPPAAEGDNGDEGPPHITVTSSEGVSLLTTPVSVDDIYAVQRNTIIVWEDQELAKVVALSFHLAEGCAETMSAIQSYQIHEASRTIDELVPPANGSKGDQKPDAPFEPTFDNLHKLIAMLSPQQVNSSFPFRDIISHMKSNQKLFSQVCSLYEEAVKTKNENAQTQIYTITKQLISPPLNGVSCVIGQVCSPESVKSAIEILGAENNTYKTYTERRCRFKNVANLSDESLAKIHYIFSLLFIKDCVAPHLLDEEATSQSPFNIFTLRLRFDVLAHICRNKGTLSALLEVGNRPAEQLCEAIPLVHELTTTVRNIMFHPDTKAEMFNSLIDQGYVPWATACLNHMASEASTTKEHNDSFVKLVESIAHLSMWCSRVRDAITDSNGALLHVLLQLLTSASNEVHLHCVYDALLSLVVGVHIPTLVTPSMDHSKVAMRAFMLRHCSDGVGMVVDIVKRCNIDGASSTVPESQLYHALKFLGALAHSIVSYTVSASSLGATKSGEQDVSTLSSSTMNQFADIVVARNVVGDVAACAGSSSSIRTRIEAMNLLQQFVSPLFIRQEGAVTAIKKCDMLKFAMKLLTHRPHCKRNNTMNSAALCLVGACCPTRTNKRLTSDRRELLEYIMDAYGSILTADADLPIATALRNISLAVEESDKAKASNNSISLDETELAIGSVADDGYLDLLNSPTPDANALKDAISEINDLPSLKKRAHAEDEEDGLALLGDTSTKCAAEPEEDQPMTKRTKSEIFSSSSHA